MSLDEIFKALAKNSMQFQQKMRASVQNLEKQIGQVATTVSKLKAKGSRKLPSQMVVNLQENSSAIILRNGAEIRDKKSHDSTKKKQVEK
ncbi:hypothetical protein PTKIN_Ptkin07bG0071800 [Pterospermum kingtungense]